MRETFEARALRNLRERHESQISENAGRIRDHIGYVLKRVEAGRADSTGMYAEDIAASVKRILRSVAALEAITEVRGIYDSAAPEADAPGPVLHETTTTTHCPRCGKDHGSQEYVDQLNAREMEP